MTVIPNPSDAALLREFANHRSQEAFNELVSRHSNWVYSTATRLVRDRHLAEDVAQAVFIVLADKAAKLSDVPLHAWLFKVTRYAAANAMRARSRRDKHERSAAMSSSETLESDPDQIWREIAPVLDDSISRLRSKDRDAILLRFYQQKTLAQVGQVMGISEGAAKIRVLRAVDKLRDLLRRAGIIIPAVGLGAVLLTQTTHAAPASFASGFSLASVSVQANTISKGVFAMLIASKIKIAAFLLLVCGISVGAGAYYFTSHGEVSPSVQSQVAPSGVAPVSAAPSLPAVADTNPGFDPRIAPFVTERTDILITVDFTKLDLNALAADMHQELAKDKLDPQSTARINGLLQMGLAGGKQWISGFQQAGGTSVYVISRSDELRAGDLAGGSTLKMTGDVVYPAASPAAALSLMNFLRRSGLTQLKVVGSAVMDPTSVPAASTGAVDFDPRPSLVSGLSAAGDSPVRIALNPAKLKEIIPKLIASGKVSSSFTGNEWDGVQFASMNLQLPPSDNPAFIIVSHYNDAASAQAAAKMASDRLNEKLKQPAAPSSPLAASMLNFMSTETFTASGSDVIGTMDLHAYYAMLFQAVNAASQAAASRPQ